MQTERGNLYEQAFESWLNERKISYRPIDQTGNHPSEEVTIKSFDFLVAPDSAAPTLVELKGRTFEGTTLQGLKGLDAWVTYDDVEALSFWYERFRQNCPGVEAVFVFMFRFANIDVETDGMDVYEYDGQLFLLLAMPVNCYKMVMKPRSPKWKTVTIAAEDFRQYAKPVSEIINY